MMQALKNAVSRPSLLVVLAAIVGLGGVVLFGFVTRTRAGSSCSNSNVSGAYGFLVSGVNLIYAPVNSGENIAAFGNFTADGKGHLSGVEFQNCWPVSTLSLHWM
jgi:hypothetical protein